MVEFLWGIIENLVDGIMKVVELIKGLISFIPNFLSFLPTEISVLLLSALSILIIIFIFKFIK